MNPSGMNSVDRLGMTLLHFIWQGALMAAVYAAARSGSRRTMGPNGRYLLACAVLAALALAPLATWLMLSAPETGSAATFAAPLSAIRVEPSHSVIAWLPDYAARVAPPSFLPWVVAFWIVGATAFSLRLFGSWIVAMRLRFTLVRAASAEWQKTLDGLRKRIFVSRPVRLLVSARLRAPVAMGWLRPAVLVPAGALAGMPPEQMEALLLHELAHIRRHDYLVHILQSAIEALFFYHPAVWWVSGHLRGERELCCDDIAVGATGDPVGYARALAELVSARGIPSAAMAANCGSVSNRIARLLGHPTPAYTTFRGLAAAPLLLLPAIGAWVAFAQPGARPQFEVASVKPSASSRMSYVRPLPGRLTADASLQVLIQYAYGVQPYQIVAPEGSILADRYQIDAKADGNASRDQMFLMLQSLLESRFGLKTHRETRTLPVYELVPAKSGLRLPAVKAGNCIESPADAAPEWAGGRMATPGEVALPKPLCGSVGVALGSNGAMLQGGNIGMPELVRRLSLMMDRSVLDRTGFAVTSTCRWNSCRTRLRHPCRLRRLAQISPASRFRRRSARRWGCSWSPQRGRSKSSSWTACNGPREIKANEPLPRQS